MGNPTTGFVLLTIEHTHSQVPRPTPSKLYIFMENPPREETKYEGIGSFRVSALNSYS